MKGMRPRPPLHDIDGEALKKGVTEDAFMAKVNAIGTSILTHLEGRKGEFDKSISHICELYKKQHQTNKQSHIIAPFETRHTELVLTARRLSVAKSIMMMLFFVLTVATLMNLKSALLRYSTELNN